ncbi:chemotaxis protein CheW [Salinivibrio sharmensis]|uniref:Chemotaxis protein CheW n=1 Tax=Salinivibrio sharmensis TaxID=390883 RepID=A0ABX3KJ51_9GAMM|nr:chemotaxis protein CheW [Salinivibrio sharmensis]OOE89002.1 chemotaxis protein CheW [Salinivibrio sharmensis]
MEKRSETSIDHVISSAEVVQILSFILDHEWFGVEISGIQEVLEYRKVTPVPRTPTFMLGVINLRGKVIPVVDLRVHFDIAVTQPTVETCIVIIHVDIDGEDTVLGILADRVQEVVEVNPADISPAPKIGNRVDSRYIYGMARCEEHFIILLRLSRIFSSDELQQVLDRTPESDPKHNDKKCPAGGNE